MGQGFIIAKARGALPHYPLEVDKGDRFRTVKKYADYLAITKGTRSYPWRAFVLGTPETFLTSNILFSLAEENRIKDPSWIKPGKVAWDWWNGWNINDLGFKGGISKKT